MSVFQSVTVKVFTIGFLALCMLIPLSQVFDLARERADLREQARARIADGWGGTQLVGGPVLAVPRPAGSARTVPNAAGWVAAEETEVILPEMLDIGGTLVVELRHYGIYAAPVYTATLQIAAKFGPDELALLTRADISNERAHAELRLPLADLRGLREVVATVNGKSRQLAPTTNVGGIDAVAIPLGSDELAAPLDVRIELGLAGTERLQFLPLARTTTVRLDAPWGDPSFVGAFLPAERTIAEAHFGARWQVLDLNRGFGQHWFAPELDASKLQAAAFGVALYQPVDIYQQNERAMKYGVLFIALTFIAFFLFEALKQLRVHPLQYLLIGLALCTFYVVLLALSEQFGFSLAYALAATAVVTLVGGYAAAVLATRHAGFLLGGALALIYALLYGLVVSEQYSLLIGAASLLATLALLMFLTRRVDWYGYGRAAS